MTAHAAADELIELGPYVAGEIPEPLVYTFVSGDGEPLDLTGFTALLSTRLVDVVTNRAAAVTDAPNGVVTYTWVPIDLSTPGVLHAELWVENGVNRFASVRFVAEVRPSIRTDFT